MKDKTALLIIDVQNDFCPAGALAVPEADKIIPVLNKYIDIFVKNKRLIFASRDWHPKETSHFKKFGGQWPGHCIRGTKGAEFHSRLRLPEDAVILSKGMDPGQDSYSAFQAVDSSGVQFSALLQKLGIKQLFAGGLATDYCVKHSVLDALKAGLGVNLLTDAVRGVNIKPGDSEDAIKQMVKCGAKKITLQQASKLLQ